MRIDDRSPRPAHGERDVGVQVRLSTRKAGRGRVLEDGVRPSGRKRGRVKHHVRQTPEDERADRLLVGVVDDDRSRVPMDVDDRHELAHRSDEREVGVADGIDRTWGRHLENVACRKARG